MYFAGDGSISIRLQIFLLSIAFALSAQADTHRLNDAELSDDEVIFLDDDDYEETTIVVRQHAIIALSPSSRIITAGQFHGKFNNLPSVLETISGVNIRSMGGYGQYAESAIRGGTAMGTRVYLDGVLLNSASAGAVDLSKIPLDRIQEIRVSKNTSGLRQMGAGMGGVIELFTGVDTNADTVGANDTESSNAAGNRQRPSLYGANFEFGSYGFLNCGMIVRRAIDNKNINNVKLGHQLNIDAAKSNNNYPFMHDNGTTVPTLRDPDPTWDDTLMRKNNNRYRSVGAAYSLLADISGRHKITQQIGVSAFDQGLFVYRYKDDQSGSTGGHTVTYNIDYRSEPAGRLTIGSEANGIFRHSKISDPDGRHFLGGAAMELEADGRAVDFLADARYAVTDNFYLAGMTGASVENYIRHNKALNSESSMDRYEYRIGAETGFTAGIAESALRFAYKYEIDTSSAGLGYWDMAHSGQKYALRYPLAETVLRLNLHPVKLQLSATASKRSPTFFEKFGWSSGFLSNPGLREETRVEVDAGAAVNMGIYSGAFTVFAGRVEGKIKSIPQNNFVRVMNFADTEFYGAELDIIAKALQVITLELNTAYLRSIIINAADPSWIGKVEPFIPAFAGYLKVEADIRQFNIGHGIKYESSCYLNIENREMKPPQSKFSAWGGYRFTDFLMIRYRVENYLNTANFDFLDNPMPRRTHVLSATFN